MDENKSASDELQKLQSNITSLFESLVSENNRLKRENEKSASYIETFGNEVTNLRKENELLRKSNNEKKRSCETCYELKERLITQNRMFTKLEKNLSNLRKFINEGPNIVAGSQFQKLLIRFLDEFGCDGSQGSASKDDTKSLTEEPGCEIVHKSPNPDKFNLHGYTGTSNEKISDEQPKEQTSKEDVDIIHIKTEGGKAESNPFFNESKRCVELIKHEFRTPSKANKYDADFIDSPFFSPTAKKGEGSPILFNGIQGPASPNQFKRKASELGRSPGKVVEKKLFLRSPNQKTYKSPGKSSKSKSKSHLRFGNSVEAEISLGGVRKLKQTQLNFEFYKGKNNEENKFSSENVIGRDPRREVNDDENKFGEDDLILGSPRQPGNSFDDFIKNFRIREQENENNHCKSTPKPDVDPDETFVHSVYLKETVRKGSEESKSTKTPPKVPSRSPEYNSVPFLYKGSPVRKKSERMKLPGQMCMECHKKLEQVLMKRCQDWRIWRKGVVEHAVRTIKALGEFKNLYEYYQAILGEIDERKMQEILNQCSKHRDRHYNLVQTPPGYWKPYLTATMDSTTQDDDTCLD